MNDVYVVLKSCVDPVFIIFVLLLAGLAFCWFGAKKKGGALFLFLVVILFYGVSITPVANYLAYSLERDYLRQKPDDARVFDVLVVLGGGSYDIRALGETYLMNGTTARLAHAVTLYHRHPSKYFICSGDGPGSVPEAELMARLALVFGVPKERIRIETKSQTTWENAQEVSKLFANKNISVGLVTSGYHMQRAEREFRKFFPEITALPAHFLYGSLCDNAVVRYMPQSAALKQTETALKEMIGQLWYAVK
ncbi:MAG: YdcF family protein [Smithellaceae bacterium]